MNCPLFPDVCQSCNVLSREWPDNREAACHSRVVLRCSSSVLVPEGRELELARGLFSQPSQPAALSKSNPSREACVPATSWDRFPRTHVIKIAFMHKVPSLPSSTTLAASQLGSNRINREAESTGRARDDGQDKVRRPRRTCRCLATPISTRPISRSTQIRTLRLADHAYRQ